MGRPRTLHRRTGIVEFYDRTLRRGRILADGELYHFKEWNAPVPCCAGVVVTFVSPAPHRAVQVRPAPGVHTGA